MNVALTVVASVAASLLSLYVLVRSALPMWLRRRMRAQMADGVVPIRALSATVDFVPIDDATRWQQTATEQVAAAFTELGYRSAGRSRVPQIDGLEVYFGTHSDGTAVAVYDHRDLPTFFDVVRTATNESSSYVTTSPLHDPGATPPGVVVVADPALTPSTAVELLHSLAPTGDLLPATADNVHRLARESYERQMAHIVTGTAPTVDEMRTVADRYAAATGVPGPTVDAAGGRLAAEVHRWERERVLHELVIQEFLRSGAVTAAEWDRMRDRVVVLHEGMSPEDRASLVPDPQGATLVGTVDRPVKATVYLLAG